MDITTWIGIASLLVIAAVGIMLTTDQYMVYVNPPSALITFGGAIASVILAFPLTKLRPLQGVLRKVFTQEDRSAVALIDNLVRYAEIARRDGILALEGQTSEIDDEFLVKGIQLAVDGTDPELIFQTMSTELDYLKERHDEGKKIIQCLGIYCPAWGMIGTLIGLVAMLIQLDDPSQVGKGMAVALLTTLYGALATYMFFFPMTDKLAMRSKEERLMKEIVIRGVMSIQSGDNPRIVAQKLKIFLPPKYRKAAEK
ncbi:MAG: motility protein A [Planctomycetes bacterium]|nr:motility protein A [Planctomycetota bacterium]